MPLRALLFDIDGTLTRSGGAGTRAVAQGLGRRPQAQGELSRMRLDGMTDRRIVRLLLAAEHPSGLPAEERLARVPEAEIDAVLAVYLTALAEECGRGAYAALPGARALLDDLFPRPDVLVGLCTGNLEEGARLKLQSTGLWGPYRFGGFGSDREDRPDIVRLAWERARALGATEGLVIGDTPRDIEAAHAAGLPCCGVATGRYRTHDLAVHGAELVLEGFGELEKARAILLGPLGR